MGRRPNYGFQKREKEIRQQKKREEKAEKKRERRELPDETASGDEAGDDDEDPVRPALSLEPGAGRDLDPALRARLRSLFDEGWDLWASFDTEVRKVNEFHPFVASEYDVVLEALLPLRAPGRTFLEWGSANGVITIMADLLGFDAYGIEIDPGLVEQARALASRTGSRARFAAGSLIPAGYRWRDRNGDRRLGTIGHGVSGYLELGRPLEEFDVVFAYPWGGEEPMMMDLMKAHGGRDARLLVYSGGGITVFPPVAPPPPAAPPRTPRP